MKKTYLFLIVTMICLIACHKAKKIQVYDEDNILYEEYTINHDSLKHGNYKRYFKTGEISESSYYTKGKLDGKRKIFYHNGNVEIEEQYRMDSLHGTFKAYYPSGKLEFTLKYVNNKIQGKAKKYYESGQLLEEVQFKDNNENGPFVEYYENGQIEWKGNYLNGDNEFGLLEQYDVNGILIKKMMCDSFGICNTIWLISDTEESE